MFFNKPEFLYRIPVLNRLLLNLIIYITNIRVKVCFSSKSSTKPFIILYGIGGFSFFLLFFWIFFHILPTSKNIINNNPVLSAIEENQEASYQDFTLNKKPKLNTNILENIKPGPTTNEEGATSSPFSPPEDLSEIPSPKSPKIKENKQGNNLLKNVKSASIAKEKVIPIPKGKNESIPHYVKVIASRTNVRSKPVLESDILARLERGYILERLRRKGDWIYIDPNVGFKGWIFHNLLEDTTINEYKLWKNSPNTTSIISLIKKSLEKKEREETENKKIKKLLHLWKLAWETKNLDNYISFYSKAFTKGKHNWESYKKYKNNVFNQPDKISIDIKNIKFQWNNYTVMASFNQTYNSKTIHSTIEKMVYFQLEKDGWKIAKELVIRKK